MIIVRAAETGRHHVQSSPAALAARVVRAHHHPYREVTR
jgi:hypothetical protein